MESWLEISTLVAVFYLMMIEFMNYILSFVLAAIIAVIGIWSFKKIRLLDKPGTDLKNTRKPVPTIQWVFVYLGFWVIIGLLFPQYLSNQLFLGLALSSLPIVLVQLLDELHYIWKIKINIPSRGRLISHIIWAVLAVYIWWIGSQEILIGSWKWIVPEYLVALFFVGWSILCINAINWFDGVYAQASGVSAIWFLTIFLLLKFVVFTSYTVFKGDSFATLTMIQNISFVLFALSLVSTVVEFKPLALVRDVWIMFYGFALAYLSVAWGAKIWTLVVTLSLVIFDALWVWAWRIFVMKKSPLKGDYTHLHHRLLGLGWTRPEARASVWIWSLVMMVLILLQWTDRSNKIVIFLLMAGIFFGINGYLFLVKKLPCGLNMKKEA